MPGPSARYGLTLPIPGLPLRAHRPLVERLADWGYTDVWSMEVDGSDAFVPLALCAQWSDELRLGTAIVPVFTRGPGLIAMSAATMAEAAPGRFVLGLGASSPAVVSAWNGITFEKPLERCRDVVALVRAALAGAKVSEETETVVVSALRLSRPPADPPPIMLAGLRPRMLALAGRIADGAILNWLAARDVPKCVDAIANPAAEVVARILVCPTADADEARALGRRMIAGYLTVPAYAAFHRWLGRGDDLASMQAAWAIGDRRGALAAIPDAVVDELVLHGTPEDCREQVLQYAAAGADTVVLALVPTPEMADPSMLSEVIRRLGPVPGS